MVDLLECWCPLLVEIFCGDVVDAGLGNAVLDLFLMFDDGGVGEDLLAEWVDVVAELAVERSLVGGVLCGLCLAAPGVGGAVEEVGGDSLVGVDGYAGEGFDVAGSAVGLEVLDDGEVRVRFGVWRVG